MATLFTELFDGFLETEINSIDLGNYTPPELSYYLTALLKRARGEFYTTAYQNSSSTINKMSDVIEFTNNTYEIQYSSDVVTQILSPKPVTGSLFYITCNDDILTNYTYDENTGTITVNEVTDNLSIIAYKNGQFNQTLSLVELDILISWMGVISLRDKIKKQKLQNLAVYGRDEGSTSQSNQLRALQQIYKDDLKDIQQRTRDYTFQQNPNLLSQLAVRG